MQLLLIAPDESLGGELTRHLASRGHHVRWQRSVTAGVDGRPEFALLDLDAAGPEGRELLLNWRDAGCDWPVIVFTGRTPTQACARGLRLGADDCLAKPFDLDELDARIDAVTRRMRRRVAPGVAPGAGALRIDPVARQAWCGDTCVDLTRMEWAVLSCLARHRGRIWSRGEIEAHLHDEGLAEARSNSLEVIVARLRRKLGAQTISTHRGLGYRLG